MRGSTKGALASTRQEEREREKAERKSGLRFNRHLSHKEVLKRRSGDYNYCTCRCMLSAGGHILQTWCYTGSTFIIFIWMTCKYLYFHNERRALLTIYCIKFDPNTLCKLTTVYANLNIFCTPIWTIWQIFKHNFQFVYMCCMVCKRPKRLLTAPSCGQLRPNYLHKSGRRHWKQSTIRGSVSV